MSTPFKRGSTFIYQVPYIPDADDPQDLSATTVTSSVRDGNGVGYTGAVVVAGDSLSFTVTITAANTALWPLALAYWDVKFVYNGVTFYSATETFDIIDNITP